MTLVYIFPSCFQGAKGDVGTGPALSEIEAFVRGLVLSDEVLDLLAAAVALKLQEKGTHVVPPHPQHACVA